ncbi:hypothetical protein M2164_005870 [Streptomyces sp. SAI-208]|uniref:hypothetical protein n=1 Tax=Streptomyces sp. SAI-208 TaxID=2940550 RepID=UPI002473A35A|nr:hypothetical protein [Streptomyces sp. SAI-208]MDH6610235.1 hypothetical protein [Streptomyces sp. SAI-208]
MGGRELEIKQLGNVEIGAEQALDATRHIACRVAAENPHPLDDDMPRLAGRLIGRDPLVAAGLLELLDALGLPTTKRQLQVLKAKAAIERTAREQRNKETS